MDTMTTETVHVLAYDDHADGDSYLSEEHEVSILDAFTVAIHLLAKHDNVCIIENQHYNLLNHDFFTVAPYSINMSVGIYAKPTEEYK